jgi:hypothetical protein
MRDRVALVVFVAGAVSVVGASSAGGQTNPLPGGLGDGSTVNQVVGNAKQQVNRLTQKAPASRGPASSGDSGHSSGSGAAGSQPAAPAASRSGAARAASSGAQGVRAASAGSARASANPGAGTAGAKSSGGKAHTASKSAATSAADPTTAPEVAGAATSASSGSGHSLPFTGSRPLQWLVLGALMGLMGVGLRFTLRRRSTA